MKELGLEETQVRSEVPGERLTYGEEDEEELSVSQAKLYQALTARPNYLAQDRSDIQFSVKELARGMAKPTKGSWKNVVKLGKYFKTHDRSGYLHQYQDLPRGANCVDRHRLRRMQENAKVNQRRSGDAGVAPNQILELNPECHCFVIGGI